VNFAGTVVRSSRSRAAAAILWGGAIAGTLDITAAFVVYRSFGMKPIPLLQGIAAGLLGESSFAGGLPTAVLGLACHFFIAFSAAAVYVLASRRMIYLLKHPLISGALYGVAVYFFMNRVVVQLSAARKYHLTLELILIGVTIHIFCIGLPIAIATRRLSAA
jgi:hypothetical protein